MQRFWEKVDRAGECWEWQGAVKAEGYGSFHLDGEMQPAHRVAYRLAKGEIPAGLEIDHLCRNRRCVNPDHLEAVTRGENQRRGMSPPGVNSRKSSCAQGHPFDESNTYHRPDGNRMCRTCNRASVRAYKQRRKEPA